MARGIHVIAAALVSAVVSSTRSVQAQTEGENQPRPTSQPEPNAEPRAREGEDSRTSAQPKFGRRGQVAIPLVGTGSAFAPLLSIQRFGSGGSSFGRISANPSADVFLSDRVSVGLGASVNRSSGDDGFVNSTEVRVIPRVGYAFPLGDTLALWARAGISFEGVVRDAPAPRGGSALGAFAGAALVHQPLRHVFIFAGPEVEARRAVEITSDPLAGPAVALTFAAGLGATL
jgi:hypothetical protein